MTSPKLWLLQQIARQNWLRYGFRARILRRFADSARINAQEFDAPFFGLRYPGNLCSEIDWSVYFYGAYEKPELLLLRDIAKCFARPTVFDVGANVGHHTLFLSQHYHQVHAFEPYEAVRAQLDQKLVRNQVRNVTVHPVGLSNRDERLPYYEPQSRNLGVGSLVETHHAGNAARGLEVQVVNGDDYIDQKSIKDVSVIKVDVEGFERFVLEGLRETLETHRPIILLEFGLSTQQAFVDKNEFLATLPESYGAVRVIGRTNVGPFNWPWCRFRPFEFDKPGGNILLFPAESPPLAVLRRSNVVPRPVRHESAQLV